MKSRAKKQDWQEIILRDVCDRIEYGYTASSTSEEVGPKFLRITDIVPPLIDWSSVPYCQIEPEKIEKYLLWNGDIVIARTGATCGFAKLIKNPPSSVFASYLIRLKVKDGVDSRFVGAVVESDHYKHFIMASNSGAAQPNANAQVLTSFPMMFPPHLAQQKIASILNAYDDLIENNLRRIKILEEMAQALYREWFIRFRFPGHEKVKMVNSSLGKIPEGWETKPIGEVVETLGGGTPSTKNPKYWENGNLIWFTPSDLTAASSMFITDSSKKITHLGQKESSARFFPPYSVMMTSRATIGVVAINTKNACTNQGFITCIPSERLSAYQLYFWIGENRDKIISVASGATYKEINRTEFRELPIIVPSVELTRNFVKLVDPMGKEIENLQNKNTNLRHTRDLLLPKLISGEIDVEKMDMNVSGLGDDAL